MNLRKAQKRIQMWESSLESTFHQSVPHLFPPVNRTTVLKPEPYKGVDFRVERTAGSEDGRERPRFSCGFAARKPESLPRRASRGRSRPPPDSSGCTIPIHDYMCDHSGAYSCGRQEHTQWR